MHDLTAPQPLTGCRVLSVVTVWSQKSPMCLISPGHRTIPCGTSRRLADAGFTLEQVESLMGLSVARPPR